MNVRTLMLLCALHSIGFALFHLAFWPLFDWRRRLSTAHPVDRAIVQVLNLRLAYVFLAIGALCLLYTDALATTPLGHALLLAMALFWVGRTVEQFVFFRETRHPAMPVLTALFVAGALLFAWPLWWPAGSPV